MNAVLPLPVLFVIFDFFYTLVHWFLHIKAIYGYIHKHHHHQKAPRFVKRLNMSFLPSTPMHNAHFHSPSIHSRANVDAVNVNPIEFFLGEYDHLWSLFLCCRFLQVHVATILVFLAVGGLLAGLNHTRFDIAISLFGLKLYDSKAHDVHHRIPQSNYGQYMMLWDYFFGSYR
jgi:sterol desaturase/sphingolipid hydroxylase (fatty acid hydroxylase superfamily)